MGHQIIQQPDGRFCVWSSVVDDLIIIDATEDDLCDYYAEDAAKKARTEIKYKIQEVRASIRPYLQFTIPYSDVAQRYDRCKQELSKS